MEDDLVEAEMSNAGSHADLIAQILRDEHALLSSQQFGPFARSGDEGQKRLITGDQASIPLLRQDVGSRLDYRMAHLARPGDIVLVRHREPAFERYLTHVLNQSGVTFISPAVATDKPLLSLARTDDLMRAQIVKALAGASVTIMPYQTTGDAWRLAEVLGELSGHVATVAGPSSRIARRANDKLWFTMLTRKLLGANAVPETVAAYGPAGATSLVARFAKTNDRVIIKVPDSAGSAGNLRLNSADIAGWPPSRLQRHLLEQLARMGWTGSYPLLVGIWDHDVITSPSVQMDIPLAQNGAPVSLGVFEQTVKGDVAEFVGAAPAVLPELMIDMLESEAQEIATVLQGLGYYGRCSFDAVLTGESDAPVSDATIHWIECNGRWTGVSIPLEATTSLLGVRPGGFVIVQDKLSQSLDTDQILAHLGDLLFCCEGAEGVVLMAPSGVGPHPVVVLAAIGHNQHAAETIAAEALRRLNSD